MAMTSFEPESGAGLETSGLPPESAGGASLTQRGDPVGFTAEVGGEPPETTDDPEEARRAVDEAAERDTGELNAGDQGGGDGGDRLDG
jgi:hypothetical protein